MATKKIKGTLDISESLVVSSSISVGGSDLSDIYAPKAVSAFGYAELDGATGKLDPSVLPAAVMEYQGTFDPTVSSTLQNGIGSAGDVYIVDANGSYDFATATAGSGTLLSIGDWVIYNGSVWEKVLNSEVAVSAGAVAYSNTTSGLAASTVQAAIDEVEVRLDTAESNATGSVTVHSDVTSAGSGEIITLAERTKLSGIEEGAQITDTVKVAAALSNNALTGVTVAPTDRVLIQDADDDNLRTVTAQDIANLASAGVSSLDDLSDVNLGTPATGQVLVYNVTEWVAAGLDAGNVSVTPLGSLTSTNVQAALEELQGDIDTLSAGSASELSDLSDVSVTTPSNGQILIYDDAGAGQFVNTNMSGSEGIIVTSSAGSITVSNYFIDEIELESPSDQPTADMALVYDASAVLHKKISVKNLAGRAVGDIFETEYTLPTGNLATSATNLTGLSFSNTNVRSFEAQVIFEASTDSQTGGSVEVYRLLGVSRSLVGEAATWDLAVESVGDNVNVSFTITNTGQVQYAFPSATALPSGTYDSDSGNFRFRASTISTASGQSV